MLNEPDTVVICLSSISITEMYELVRESEGNENSNYDLLKRIGICDKCQKLKSRLEKAKCWHAKYEDPPWRGRKRAMQLRETYNTLGMEREYFEENFSLTTERDTSYFGKEAVKNLFNPDNWHSPETIDSDNIPEMIIIGIDTSEGKARLCISGFGFYRDSFITVNFFFQSRFPFFV